MKTCFLITSFCNSEKKVSCLENCIDNLKKISKNDICIHAHFPLPSSIQTQVTHFMYDYSNPILKFPEKYLNFWRKHMDSNLTMSIAKNDFGFTVLQQWKRGYDYLKQLGYDSIIVINYDVIITENLLRSINHGLYNREGLIFYFKDTVNTTLIALRTTVDNIMKEIDINKYKQQNGFAENFIENLVDKSEYNLLKIMPDEYRNDFYTTMDVEGDKTFQAFDQPEDGNSPFDPFTFNGFKIHIGEKDELNKLMFLFFDIVDSIDIELNIKDKEYHKINGIKNKHFIIETTISYDDFLSDSYSIMLKVNGDEISRDILDLFKEHSRLQKN